MRPRWIWIAGLALAGCSESPEPERPPSSPASTVQAPAPVKLEFVGSESCAECHESAFAAWQGSHHQLAMQTATVDTILGDFSRGRFDHFGDQTEFRQTAEGFVIESGGQVFPITQVFGIEPLQQYLAEFPAGRYQIPWVSWDTQKDQWFHLYPGEAIPPGDELHWTGAMGNWNSQCAECHSTGLKKNYDPAGDTYSTEFAEISVGCEACHGRGSRHVAWAGDPSGQARYARNMGLELDLSRGQVAWVMDRETGIAQRQPALKRHRQVEACARCHSRRTAQTDDYPFGRPLLDSHRPALITDPLYFADGQIRDEVYVYGSFLQSRMYEAGVQCSDCHNPHSGELVAEGDFVCGQCHQADRYAATEHHRHDPQSVACVDCHMAEETYMVVDPRRDHSFRVPRPDLSVAIDVPNACQTCHSDRTDESLVTTIRDWYPEGRQDQIHFGLALHAAWTDDPSAEAYLLAILEGDLSPIVRSSALLALHGRISDSSLLAPVESGLRHRDPLVRFGALRALAGLPAQIVEPMVSPLLSDRVRNVRIEAARLLAESTQATADNAAFERAAEELIAAETFNLDREFGYLNLANFLAARGRLEEAQSHYETGLKRFPESVALHINRADLHRRAGEDEQGLSLLAAALSLQPDSAVAHEALALTLVRLSRYREAVEALDRGIISLPGHRRLRYLLVLTLDRAGDQERARSELESLQRDYPEAPEIQSLQVSVES